MNDQSEQVDLTSGDPNLDRIEGLRELFPEAFTEGKIDFEKLRLSLGDEVDEGKERYGLSWAGKADAYRAVQVSSIGTLIPYPEESVDWDTTENVIIEGDNLEVLKLLQKSYHGQVKLILIDPPYNTGGEFIYPDNFKEGLKDYLEFTKQVNGGGARLSSNTDSSGRYHSNWLSMMLPRLFIARGLLQESGVLAMHIDDHEVQNARALLNEVFGEENFVDCLIWKKRYGGGAKEKHLVSLHEYILVYSRNKELLPSLFVSLSEASKDRYYKSKDKHFDTKGPYRTHPLESMKSFAERKNLVFAIPAPDGSVVWPKRQWRWSKARVERALEIDEIEFSKVKDGTWILSSKQYLNEDGEVRKTKFFSIIEDTYSQHGTAEILKLFGDARVFSFPKPTKLVQHLLELFTDQDESDVILDFFAGSGSVAHGVFEQNLKDGGNRNFILAQLPEPTDISEYSTIADITRERVRRAAKVIAKRQSGQARLEDIEPLDLGFRSFKLAESNFKVWNSEEGAIMPDILADNLLAFADSQANASTKDGMLWELILKLGYPLSSEIVKLPEIADTFCVGIVSDEALSKYGLAICLASNLTEADVSILTKLPVRKVVALDSAFAGNDQLKTNAVLQMRDAGIEYRTV